MKKLVLFCVLVCVESMAFAVVFLYLPDGRERYHCRSDSYGFSHYIDSLYDHFDDRHSEFSIDKELEKQELKFYNKVNNRNPNIFNRVVGTVSSRTVYNAANKKIGSYELVASLGRNDIFVYYNASGKKVGSFDHTTNRFYDASDKLIGYLTYSRNTGGFQISQFVYVGCIHFFLHPVFVSQPPAQSAQPAPKPQQQSQPQQQQPQARQQPAQPAPQSQQQQNANTAQAYNQSGKAAFDRKDYDKAIADYTQAIRLDPNNYSLYDMRGLSYHRKKDYVNAIADYSQSLRLKPANLVYLNRGIAYSDKGDYDSAIADFTKAIQGGLLNYAPLYVLRANAYYKKGDYRKARTDINSALKIDSNNQEAKDLDAELKKKGY